MVDPVEVIDLLGAIDADPNSDLIALEEIYDFVVDEDAIGLNGKLGLAARVFQDFARLGLASPTVVPFIVHVAVRAIQVAPTGDFYDVGIALHSLFRHSG